MVIDMEAKIQRMDKDTSNHKAKIQRMDKDASDYKPKIEEDASDFKAEMRSMDADLTMLMGIYLYSCCCHMLKVPFVAVDEN
jgi:hypothetical protein